MKKIFLVIPLCAGLLFAGCNTAAPTQTTTSTTTSSTSNSAANQTSSVTIASSTTTSSHDACALISHDDLQTAVGQTIQPTPTSGTEDSESTCTWNIQGTSGDAVNFTIMYRNNEVKLFQDAKDHPILETPTVALPGIGDDAFFDPSISIVHILKGSVQLTIQYIAEPATEKDMEIKLANLVVGKL